MLMYIHQSSSCPRLRVSCTYNLYHQVPCPVKENGAKMNARNSMSSDIQLEQQKCLSGQLVIFSDDTCKFAGHKQTWLVLGRIIIICCKLEVGRNFSLKLVIFQLDEGKHKQDLFLQQMVENYLWRHKFSSRLSTHCRVLLFLCRNLMENSKLPLNDCQRIACYIYFKIYV